MSPLASEDLVGVIAIGAVFGSGLLIALAHIIATNWRKTRVAEQNAVLKSAMLEKGFTASEIARVIECGVDADDRFSHPQRM